MVSRFGSLPKRTTSLSDWEAAASLALSRFPAVRSVNAAETLRGARLANSARAATVATEVEMRVAGIRNADHERPRKV
jgi:hypothetical protein